ncbi:GtrA family protein [Methylobacterium radiodurans]|uniref:GtrA family protein n=1 Tax=Methylobacterium radiodurans TaxID=2202828 RepID=A0A2U8VZM6_9HYPH|nr:GtrA family protein [Methylobacterium radiodurans]
MDHPVIRFLIAGGSAAAINWLARLALSPVLPFGAALIVAQGIGLVAGFWLYRAFVFRAAGGSLRRQLPAFLGVNAASAVIVLAVSLAASAALVRGLGLTVPVAEGIGHALGIGAGAVANYLGHRFVTFAGLADLGAAR